MSDTGRSRQQLDAVHSLIKSDPRLQPTLSDLALQGVLQRSLADLRGRRTSHPAEAISRQLINLGIRGYSGSVIISGGGYGYMPGFEEWEEGLELPPLLVDHCFGFISMGKDWVFKSIDLIREAPAAEGRLPWNYELVRSKVEEASGRLRLNSSGVGVVEWLVNDQLAHLRGIHNETYYQAGLVASSRVYAELLMAVAANGFEPGGPIYGSPGW